MIQASLIKYAIVIALFTAWTFGNRWQATQSLKHEYAIEKAQREAVGKESQRLNEQAATKIKESYASELQALKIDSSRLDSVLKRLHDAKPTSEACNPIGATSAPAPQFEW